MLDIRTQTEVYALNMWPTYDAPILNRLRNQGVNMALFIFTLLNNHPRKTVLIPISTPVCFIGWKNLFFKWGMFPPENTTNISTELEVETDTWILGVFQDWRQKENGTTEDEVVGWHHRLNGHEFEQTPVDSKGQGNLACCSSWGHKESDTT